MSARCDDCGRTVPPEEKREGPYAHGSGRWTCLACITDAEVQVERFWEDLKDTEPVPDPMDALRKRFLEQLGEP